MIVAGVMSGTSLDGIDVATVEIGRSIRVLHHTTTAYPSKLRAAILAVSNRECHTAQISRLNFSLAHAYAKALAPHLAKFKIALIGSHGQTVYHEGESKTPNTLQIGDGSVLAELTGVPVVSDFRPRDMAAGGKGAPLVPYFDFQLFRHSKRVRVAVNIGGIANLTYIPAAAKPEDVQAFDTGPGNMVLDQLMSHFTNGKKSFDRGGRIALTGHLNPELLAELVSDPFYTAKPPKTAGREQYGEAFVGRFLHAGLSMEDALATAVHLTATTIRKGVSLMKTEPDDVILGGGGVHNQLLMQTLRSAFPGSNVTTTLDFGIHPDAKEAVAFALLAHATWNRKPSNIPSATGARRAVVLGKISW